VSWPPLVLPTSTAAADRPTAELDLAPIRELSFSLKPSLTERDVSRRLEVRESARAWKSQDDRVWLRKDNDREGDPEKLASVHLGRFEKRKRRREGGQILVLDGVLFATLVAVDVVLLHRRVDRISAVRALDDEVALGEPDRPGVAVLGRARAPHDEAIWFRSTLVSPWNGGETRSSDSQAVMMTKPVRGMT